MIAHDDSDTTRFPGLLIVEPDAKLRRELTRGMEAQGWRVWTASDEATALEIYRRARKLIDVALVDCQLPDLEGERILAKLAELDPDLIKCAMSADLDPYAAAALRRMSDTPLFTKPLSIRALAFTLYEIIMPVARV